MLKERRKKRRNQLRKAIRYQFQDVVKTYEINSFSLADERGLLVAASADNRRNEILAAFAPLFFRLLEPGARKKMYKSLNLHLPEVNVDQIAVRVFHSDGEPLYLCAIGKRSGKKDAGIYRAVSGVRRILNYV